MANGKLKIEISAESKQATKELNNITKKIQRQENEVAKLDAAYAKLATTIEKQMYGGGSRAETLKGLQAQKEQIDALKLSAEELAKTYPKLQELYDFSQKPGVNKGLLSIQARKSGINLDVIYEYGRLMARINKETIRYEQSLKNLEKRDEVFKRIMRDSAEYKNLEEAKKALDDLKRQYAEVQKEADRLAEADRKFAEAEQRAAEEEAQRVAEQQRQHEELEKQHKKEAEAKAAVAGYGADIFPNIAKIIAVVQKIKKIIDNIVTAVKSVGAAVSAIIGVIAGVLLYVKLCVKAAKIGLKVIGEILKVLGKISLAFGKIIFKAVSGVFNSIAEKFKNAKSAFESLFKRIKNALLYGLIRPIRTALANFTEYIGKVLKQNDQIAASLARIKGAGLVLIEQLTTTIAPILVRILDLLTRIISAVSTLLGSLGILKKASKASAKSMAAAAEDAKDMFASWDTVQKLSDKSAGDITPDFNFEEWKMPDWLEKLLKGEDWTELGRKIGEWLGGIIEKINNWIDNKFSPFMGKLGTRLATLINGMLDFALDPLTSDRKQLGYLIANFFNALFKGMNNFVKKLHWKDIGSYIAKQINIGLKKFRAKQAGEAIGGFIKGILDALINAVDETDWNQLANKIADFIEAMDWPGIIDRVANGLSSTLTAAIDFIWSLLKRNAEADKENQVGAVAATMINKLTGAFQEAVNNGKWEEIVNGIMDQINLFFDTINADDLTNLILSIVELLFNVFQLVIERVEWPTITAKIEEALDNLKLSKDARASLSNLVSSLLDLLGNLLNTVLTDVGPALLDFGHQIIRGIWKGIWAAASDKALSRSGLTVGEDLDGVAGKISEKLQSIFRISSPSKVTEDEVGQYVGAGVLTGAAKYVNDNASTWADKDIAEKILSALNTAFGIGRKGNSSTKMEEVGRAITNGIANGIKDNLQPVKNAMNQVIQIVETAINRILSNVNGITFTTGSTGISTSRSSISIPRLAQGTVVNPGHAFTAILGDNRQEQEIVSPLSTMKQALLEALSESGMTNGRDIVLQVDGRTFARVTAPYYTDVSRRLGVSAIR